MDKNLLLPCGLEADSEQIYELDDESSSEPPGDMDDSDSEDEDLDPCSALSKCNICCKKLKARWFPDSCLHKFCFLCGYKWMSVRKVCPVCNKQNFSLIHWAAPSYNCFKSGIIYEKFEDWIKVTSSFRKKIYAQNVWVEGLANFSDCYKEFTPQLYSDHPSQIQRLAPWLKREAYSLLNYLGSHDYSDDVVKIILNMLPNHSIQSQELLSAIQPYFGTQNNHFLHEFYTFACSFFDIHGFDDHAFYYASSSEGQPCTMNLYIDIQEWWNRDDKNEPRKKIFSK